MLMYKLLLWQIMYLSDTYTIIITYHIYTSCLSDYAKKSFESIKSYTHKNQSKLHQIILPIQADKIKNQNLKSLLEIKKNRDRGAKYRRIVRFRIERGVSGVDSGEFPAESNTDPQRQNRFGSIWDFGEWGVSGGGDGEFPAMVKGSGGGEIVNVRERTEREEIVNEGESEWERESDSRKRKWIWKNNKK